MKAYAFCLLISVGVLPLASAQSSVIEDEQGRKIAVARQVDPQQYLDMEGHPYLNADWHSGELISSQGERIDSVTLNYNGLTGNLEVQHEQERYELDPRSYISVRLPVGPDTAQFYRGVHPDFSTRYVWVLHNGPQGMLIRDFRVRKDKVAPNGMTTTRTVTNLRTFNHYYLLRAGVLEPVSMRAKKTIRLLRLDATTQAWIKAQQLDIGNEADLVTLLKHLDERQ